jgi:methylthioribose-1-phosphate isomerase
MLPTIEWNDEGVVMIDQRKLPGAEVYVKCKTPQQVAKAIKTMVIRGAPAIGVAAAMGLALGVRMSKATGTQKLATEFYKTCELMAVTRPTAVNLFWAIDRMKRVFAEATGAGQSVDQIKDRLEAEARRIHDEDVASCRAMGAFGATMVPQTARVLTHCNAGALATAGYGTALGVIRGAVEQGKKVVVFADETRPFLQGSRLTAWELTRDGIDTTVITDNMAASMMRLGHVDLVVVGADRIAANGDVANKVGTYGVAVLAREHGIPFYVAAPISTVDLDTPDGEHIPIEERSEKEVTHVGASRLTPDGARIRNPAFDVTPAKYITAIITERGIASAPYSDSLRALVEPEREHARLRAERSGEASPGRSAEADRPASTASRVALRPDLGGGGNRAARSRKRERR